MKRKNKMEIKVPLYKVFSSELTAYEKGRQDTKKADLLLVDSWIEYYRSNAKSYDKPKQFATWNTKDLIHHLNILKQQLESKTK